jgi:predicted Zn-dependent protease
MKNWKTWIMFVIFGVVLVAAAALIIYGVDTHTEPDLMSVCWQPDGYACYDECSCGETETLVWPQGMPLSVVALDHAGNVLSRMPGPVLTAIADINAQLGATFLVPVRTRDNADIELTFRAAYDIDTAARRLDGVPGYCEHRRQDGRLRSFVAVRPGGDTRYEYRVAVHELGHALGLAHDDYGASIMFHTVYDDREDARMSFTAFSEWDKRVLRQQYGFEE